MFRHIAHLTSLSILLMLAVLSQSALADKLEWEPVTPEDWAVGQDSARGIFDAVMLFEKVQADDRKLMDSEYKRTIYRRVRILGPSGREWADVEAPFYTVDQKIKEIKGRTLLPDGTVIELAKDKIFEKEAFKTKGEEYTQYTFSLPGVTDNCIVEYMISYELDAYVAEWIIQKTIPLLRCEMDWWLPKFNLNVSESIAEEIRDLVTPNYLCLNTAAPMDVQQLPNLKAPEELKISLGFIPAFKSEPHTVPDKSLQTKLYTYYGSRVPPATYWGQRATNLEKSVRDFCKKDKRLKEVVKRFADLPSNDEKIAAAYNWLRDSILNLSYYDLTELKDGQRRKKDPDEIEYVDDLFKYRYGHRAGIDKAFVDMLLEMNIDAKYCYAKDRFDDLFVSEAKYWQFDRTLVAVPVGTGAYKFYTVGHECTPIETVPWYLEGVQVLLGGANDLMVAVPFSPPDYSVTQANYTVFINEDLEPSGMMASRSTGHDGRAVRVKLIDEDTADFAGLLTEGIEKLFPAAKVDSIAVDQLADISKPVLLSCRLKYPELQTAGSRILLKPFDFCSAVENPFYAPERKSTILFDYAYELRETAYIELPAGYTVEALPADTTFQNEIGQCVIGFQLNDNTLVAQRFFRLNRPFWGVTDYPSVQALFQSRQDLSGQIVMLSESDESDADRSDETPVTGSINE